MTTNELDPDFAPKTLCAQFCLKWIQARTAVTHLRASDKFFSFSLSKGISLVSLAYPIKVKNINLIRQL